MSRRTGVRNDWAGALLDGAPCPRPLIRCATGVARSYLQQQNLKPLWLHDVESESWSMAMAL